MFKELHSLIQNRPLTITVAALGGGKVRVNVVPQTLGSDSEVNDKIGHSNKDKIAKVPDSAITVLTTPLSLTGTPEEIDAELPQILTQFAESHVQLQRTVEQAKEQIADAVKVIQEREKTKPKSSSANAAKRDENTEKQPAGEAELLPLWVKPRSDASATATNEKSAGSSTDGVPGPVQQTLNTETEEVTS